MITIQPFAQTKAGKAVNLVKLKNINGMEAHFLTYGAILQRLIVPASTSSFADVVLGYNDLKSYEEDDSYVGQLVGRNANRIANAEATLEGEKIKLSANERTNNLHGGFENFGKKNWDVENLGNEVLFTYESPDGEEGFPGNLKTKFFVRLSDANELLMGFESTTDKETLVNLTRHEYFNLDTKKKHTIEKHRLKINADEYLPKNEHNVPTGEFRAVSSTPFDLTEAKVLKDAIAAIDGGFDHNYVLNDRANDAAAAVLKAGRGNLKMELYCTQPGLQFYSANSMTNHSGKFGSISGPCPALCLEPQHFPDTPNHDNFPTTVLKPGETYQHEISYKFYYE